jgi:pyruvate dehydrogenase E1 component
VPNCQAYDPAFAYELAAIIRHGIDRMYFGAGDGSRVDDGLGDRVFFYLTLYNENYEMPAMPTGITEQDVINGIYRWSDAPDLGTDAPRATILFSGSAQGAARQAQAELAEHYGVAAELWSVPSYKRLRENALSVERWNRLHPGDQPRVPFVTERLTASAGPIVAVTDFMKVVPDQIARFVPADASGRPRAFTPLGTDGFGRSDTREALRRFFETDAAHIQVAVLAGLAADGHIDSSVVLDCIKRNDIDPDTADPRTR